MVDLKGKVFNRLTVQYYVGHSMWHCKYSCGNEKNIRASSLKSGATQSCGCLQKQRSTKNLIGKKFGKLTVIEDSGERYDKNIIWLCKCDCGRLYKARSTHLLDGHILSCGCEKISRGEYEIQKILKQNNIPYEREKTFQTCRFPDTNALARFDFYVDNKYLIEFDGAQHFKKVDFFGGQKGFQKRIQKDFFKTQWCKKQGIPLIRISYTKIGDIVLQDLLLKQRQD